jgi:hypothetical protein
MKILGLTLFIIGVWTAYELWRAPMMDEQTGKTIKPAKTLKDLFKRK